MVPRQAGEASRVGAHLIHMYIVVPIWLAVVRFSRAAIARCSLVLLTLHVPPSDTNVDHSECASDLALSRWIIPSVNTSALAIPLFGPALQCTRNRLTGPSIKSRKPPFVL